MQEVNDETIGRVFMSYAHDSPEHKQDVLEYSDWLNDPGGIECWIDTYVEDTMLPEGWPLWMRKQLKKAEFILVVCSPRYQERLDRDPKEEGKGLGVKFESVLILNDFYQNQSLNTKYIPVVLDEKHVSCIPDFLNNQTHYNLSDEKSKQKLFRKLIKEPEHVKPKVRRGLIGFLTKEKITDKDDEQKLTSKVLNIPEIKPLLQMKPGTKILQSFFGLTVAKRFGIAGELGLIEKGESVDSPNLDKLTATFLERAYTKNLLAELWNKLFDENIDPNPFKK